MIGFVFISEGIQKFLFPENSGVGRFIKIGIPYPDIFSPFVGVTEVLCGFLLLAGLMTRIAAIPLIIEMVVAILSTKIPILSEKGFWAMAHESRTDFCMVTGCIFLLITGGGKWSADHFFYTNGKK